VTTVYHQFVPHVLEQRRNLVADQVAGQRHERAGPVVDDDVALGRGDLLHQGIEVPGVDLVAVHDVQALHVQGLVTLKRAVDRIGVDAKRRLPLARFVLRNGGRDHRLADAALALQNHVNARH